MSGLLEKQRQQIVVVGLGNPGKQYEMTRHNIGFLVVRALAEKIGIAFKDHRRISALVGKGEHEGATVHLVMPTTYMNLSGVAVQQYLNYYKLGVEDLLVIVDDVALPFGKMRLRPLGGAGGHNGLKSIEQHLGTQSYLRLRMGVGDRDHGTLTDHVLGGFSVEERKALPAFVDQGGAVALGLLSHDVESMMQEFNAKNNKNYQRPRAARQENNHETEEEEPL